jgi:hypothetical protein
MKCCIGIATGGGASLYLKLSRKKSYKTIKSASKKLCIEQEEINNKRHIFHCVIIIVLITLA